MRRRAAMEFDASINIRVPSRVKARGAAQAEREGVKPAVVFRRILVRHFLGRRRRKRS